MGGSRRRSAGNFTFVPPLSQVRQLIEAFCTNNFFIRFSIRGVKRADLVAAAADETEAVCEAAFQSCHPTQDVKCFRSIIFYRFTESLDQFAKDREKSRPREIISRVLSRKLGVLLSFVLPATAER